MASIFEVQDDGQIVYIPSDSEAESSAPLEQGESAAELEANEAEIIESEVNENGNNDVEVSNQGTVLSDTVQAEEIIEEIQETESGSDSDSSYTISLLADETEALLVDALTPASGTLNSSTMDYFDRVVSGLPADYKYIGYRTNANNAYDGVLYFGDDYKVDNNVITFGDDTTELRVYRTSSGNTTITNYSENTVDGASIAFDLDGDVIYYTNAEVGYPVMGGVVQTFNYAPLIAVGLLSAMAVVILQKLLLKR